MVKVYLARQPIIDRNGRVFAYELLFRSGFSSSAQVSDSQRATAKVIESVLSSFTLRDIIRDRKGFINIDENTDVLGVVELLPPDRIGFEVLETSVLGEEFLDKLKRLKELGYELSLDDFVYEEKFIPYLKLVDYVKIDVLANSPESVGAIVDAVSKHDVKLIAEKVETYEVYETYLDMGFHYFQGFFFQKPKIVVSKTVEPAYAALVKLYNLVSEEKDVSELEKVFKKFSKLAVKLLQLINSAYYSLRQPVRSIRHAVLMLGYRNLLKWLLLLMYSVRQEDFPSDPLFEEASVRGFFIEKLAERITSDKNVIEKAFITGILSLVDVLLGIPMEEAVKNLILEEDIKDALISRKGTLGELLSIVESAQTGNLKKLAALVEKYRDKGLNTEVVLNCQMEALRAYSQLEF